MITTCLFDLDGTLLDTLGGITHFVNQTARKYGFGEITPEQTKVFVGNGAEMLIRRAFLAGGLDPDADEALFRRALADYNAAYDADCYYKTAPYPGIPEALAGLKARRIRLGVISNKPDPTAKSTVRHFFPGVFDEVLGAREGVALKPDPAGAKELCALLGASPEQALYFGDTGTDMKTGLALGAAATVGVLWGFRSRKELEENRAQILIGHPSEILGILNKFEKG